MESVQWRQWVLDCHFNATLPRDRIISLMQHHAVSRNMEWIKHDRDSVRYFVNSTIKRRTTTPSRRELYQEWDKIIIELLDRQTYFE